MHYHLEIVMPPVENIENAIEAILAPFSEHDGEDGPNQNSFWDWWQIGGRYSGSKIEAACGGRLQEFRDWLNAEGVTVSGVQFGKPTLYPADQRGKVDAKWAEMFPTAGPTCPLFDYSGKQMHGDICEVGHMPDGLQAYSCIIAGPSFNNGKYDGPLQANELLHKSIWNGCTHQDTTWDGTVESAISLHKQRIESYADEYKKAATIQTDWLVVTVDYHS